MEGSTKSLYYLLVLLICGDFNIHVDSTTCRDKTAFLGTLSSYGLHQHVSQPTHKHGHQLDLIITRLEDKNIIRLITSDDSLNISDHHWITAELNLNKPKVATKDICTRKFSKIDLETLKTDISNLTIIESDNINNIVDAYNSTLTKLIDEHAPKKHMTISLRPHAPWYSCAIAVAKRKRRQAERKWRGTNLIVDRDIYANERDAVNSMIAQAKKNYYTDKIENAPNSKSLFKIVDGLLNGKPTAALPSLGTDSEVAESFNHFFT